jgi:hypothetical protein
MSNLTLFVLAAYAAWYIFSTAELPIWHRIRDAISSRSVVFFKFIDCPICSGFWVSLALSFVFPIAETAPLFGPAWGAVSSSLVQAFAGAGAVYLIETHVRRLEER